MLQGANSKLESKEGHTARVLALKANHRMVVSLLDNAQYVHSYAEGEGEGLTVRCEGGAYNEVRGRSSQ